ncbi:ABC transporter substrate-binding protein [Mesorhizobium sp.]|uniref:ABC transporter substrate-binding protein n=1 Tax=Mesorhizobium sp. TaxID=1871066 RepID=UPI002600F449|nr:ABC transporter substrate-binding protein [Mesorhizobium sp.]
MTEFSNHFAISRRGLMRLGALAAGAAILPVLPVGRAGAATKLIVGYTEGPEFGATYIAKEKGFFEKHGLDVSLQTITLTSNVPATIVSKSLEIGGTTPSVFLTAVDSGVDLVGIAASAGHRGADEAVGVVAGAKTGIAKPTDLAGKRFGVPGLTGALHIMCVAWLRGQGVDTSKVDFVEIPFPQLPEVLAAGNVDAVVTINAFVKMMVAKGTGVVIPGFAESFPNGMAADVYVADRKWAGENAEVVASFRAALADAVAFAGTDQKAAREAMGVYFKVPPEVLAAIPFPDLQSTLTTAHLKFWADALVDQGYLSKAPDLAHLIA